MYKKKKEKENKLLKITLSFYRRRSHTAPRITARDASVHGRKRYAIFGRPSGRLDDGVVRGRGQRIQRSHHVRGAQKPIAKTQRAIGKSVDKV